MQGHFEAAISDYTRALRIDPSHTRTLYNRASCYEKLQRLEEALADYSTAITLEEGSAKAYFARWEQTTHRSAEIPAALMTHALPASEAGSKLDVLAHASHACPAIFRGNPVCASIRQVTCLRRLRMHVKVSYTRSISGLTEDACGCRAGVHERLGRQADALDDYDQAISLDSSFAEAFHAR